MRLPSLLTLSVVLGAASLHAQQNPPVTPPPATPASAAADALNGAPRPARNPQEFEELQILHRFLSLPPERLAEIRQTIEKIEKLTPEERQALRQKVEQLRKEMPPDEFTAKLGPAGEKLGGKDRFILVSTLRFMKEEGRKEFFTRYDAATPEEKAKILEETVTQARERFRAGGDGFKRRDRDKEKEAGPPGPPDGKPSGKPGEEGPRPPRPDRPHRPPQNGETPPPAVPAPPKEA